MTHALFSQRRLTDYLDERRAQAKQAAQKLPVAQLRERGAEAAAESLAAE